MDFVLQHCFRFTDWRRHRSRLRQGQWDASRGSIASSEKSLRREEKQYRRTPKMKSVLRLFRRGNPCRGMKFAWWTMPAWKSRRGLKDFYGFADRRRLPGITKIKRPRMRCCRWGPGMEMGTSRG